MCDTLSLLPVRGPDRWHCMTRANLSLGRAPVSRSFFHSAQAHLRGFHKSASPLSFANQIGARILTHAGPRGSLPVKRIVLVFVLGTCAGSTALAADLPPPVPGPQPICNPVASWTDWPGAVCIKYLCPGFNVQIRCGAPPPLGFTGPIGPYPY